MRLSVDNIPEDDEPESENGEDEKDKPLIDDDELSKMIPVLFP